MGLSKPLPQHHFVELPFFVYVIGLFAIFLAKVRCLRERLVVGFATLSMIIGVLSAYLPAVANSLDGLVSYFRFALWVAASLISLTMLVSSARRTEST
jgi:hypothetical protein